MGCLVRKRLGRTACEVSTMLIACFTLCLFLYTSKFSCRQAIIHLVLVPAKGLPWSSVHDEISEASPSGTTLWYNPI